MFSHTHSPPTVKSEKQDADNIDDKDIKDLPEKKDTKPVVSPPVFLHYRSTFGKR